MPDPRLVPPGIDDAVSRAINQLLDRFDGLDLSVELLCLVERQPDLVLEYLAWQRHVDFWDRAQTRADKLALLAACYDAHRYKGTRFGMERLFTLLDAPGSVVEWFEYGGDPYYFCVNLDWLGKAWNDGLTTETLDLIERLKNVRSWLDHLRIFLSDRPAPPLAPGLTIAVAEAYPFKLRFINCYDVVAADVQATDLDSLGLTRESAEPWAFAVALPALDRTNLDAYPHYDDIPADFGPVDGMMEVTHV